MHEAVTEVQGTEMYSIGSKMFGLLDCGSLMRRKTITSQIFSDMFKYVQCLAQAIGSNMIQYKLGRRGASASMQSRRGHISLLKSSRIHRMTAKIFTVTPCPPDSSKQFWMRSMMPCDAIGIQNHLAARPEDPKGDGQTHHEAEANVAEEGQTWADYTPAAKRSSMPRRYTDV